MNSADCVHNNQLEAQSAGLTSYRENFVRVVSAHMKTMPGEELDMLDGLSRRGDQAKSIANYKSIEDRVAELTCIDELSVMDMLLSPFFCRKASVIGYVAQRPVFYFNGSGIYQWGDTPDEQSLSYWISYPACPPGWEID